MNRKLKRVVVTAMAVATMAVGLPATQASAIDRVDCAGRTDFLSVQNNTNPFTSQPLIDCFANAGYTQVYIDDVTFVDSGNNVATFCWTDIAGYYACDTLPKWQYFPLYIGSPYNTGSVVWSLQIY